MDMKKWMAVVAVLALAGCGNDEEGQRVPLGDEPAQSEDGRAAWPDGLAEQVDSANLEYSTQDYAASAARYRALTEEYPDIGTLWFGLYMAENAQGNTEAAEAALEKAEELAPGLGRMHEAAESGAMDGGHPPMQMPEGHPNPDSVNPDDAPPLGGTGG